MADRANPVARRLRQLVASDRLRAKHFHGEMFVDTAIKRAIDGGSLSIDYGVDD